MPATDMSGDALLSALPQQPKKRKHNTSKQKGKRAERECAEILTERLGHPFQRIYCSGASVGRSNSYRLEQLTKGQALSQLGDVMPPEYMAAQFVTESKNYAALDFHALLTPKGSRMLLGWYGEMMYDCESAIGFMAGGKAKAKPVVGWLFVKITRKGEWIVFDQGMMLAAIGAFSVPTPHLIFEAVQRIALVEAGWNGTCVMCGFDDFVAANAVALSRVDDAEYQAYVSGGPKKLEDASVEDLERMLAEKRKAACDG